VKIELEGLADQGLPGFALRRRQQFEYALSGALMRAIETGRWPVPLARPRSIERAVMGTVVVGIAVMGTVVTSTLRTRPVVFGFCSATTKFLTRRPAARWMSIELVVRFATWRSTVGIGPLVGVPVYQGFTIGAMRWGVIRRAMIWRAVIARAPTRAMVEPLMLRRSRTFFLDDLGDLLALLAGEP